MDNKRSGQLALPRRVKTSHNSDTEFYDIDDTLDVWKFRQDALAIYPDFEEQLLHLTKKLRFSQCSELGHLWRMGKLLQDQHFKRLDVPLYIRQHGKTVCGKDIGIKSYVSSNRDELERCRETLEEHNLFLEAQIYALQNELRDKKKEMWELEFQVYTYEHDILLKIENRRNTQTICKFQEPNGPKLNRNRAHASESLTYLEQEVKQPPEDSSYEWREYPLENRNAHVYAIKKQTETRIYQTIPSYSKEINDLPLEHKNLQEYLRIKDKEYKSMLHQNLANEKSIKNANDQITQLKHENYELQHKLQLQEAREDFKLVNDLRQEIDQSRNELEENKYRLNTLQSEIKHLKAELMQEKQKAKIKEEDCNRLQNMLTQTRENNSKVNEDFSVGRETGKNMGSYKTTQIQEENHYLQKEVEQLNNKIKSLSNDLKQVRESVKLKENECISIQKKLAQAIAENASIKAADEIQGQQSEKMKELQYQLQQLQNVQKQLTDDLRLERESKRNMESNKNSHIAEENNRLQKEVEQLHRKLKSLNDDLKIKENEWMSMRRISDQTTAEITSLMTANKVQRQRGEKISVLQEKVQQLERDNEILTEDLRHEKESRKNDSYELSKLQEKTQKLQNELDQLRQQNQSLKDKLIHEKENFKFKEEECNSMKRMVKTQKEQHVSLRVANDREKQLNERNFELQNKIHELLKANDNLNEEIRRVKEMEKKLETFGDKDAQKINQTLQQDANQLHYQNQRLLEDLKCEKESIKKLEMENNKNSSVLQERIKRLEQEIVSLKAKLAEKSDRNSKVDSRLRKKLESDKDLQQHLDETRDKLKCVQKELDDTKSRLSRAMGDRLTDNNPNIADLSDKNRPTKISERFQELYDNQWTDAFEVVNATCLNEENTINILRIFLMDTLEFCKTHAAYQMDQIKLTFLKGEELPANMIKQVKECRKAMAELYGKGLYQDYCKQLRTSKSLAMNTPSYVKECFEICWLMAVQDPSVVFGPDIHRGDTFNKDHYKAYTRSGERLQDPSVVFGPDIHRGDTFNKDHYKAYTRSGERVDFVVWPVLLLHQNGHVLCKGVAQGK